ncbi:TetR/AcrR family transcriptional repressor of nem operon [Tardiphaga robiniae]|uniref:TetR/AcrR family transcriptional regulator n=1 Tax=Tardiphaga robiniae TaxID=943830 RepID=UPI00286552F2|nr:TetR family transcriptional regulator [Tardiphaga robiniae]MDR6660824.1 TetR/AcrR family transcriptional repressor of nem operon [Tardiphaga robiniae]
MGRSSRQEADENRAKIVEAASRIFRRSGVDAVSISDVMTEVGMTQGGFYKHFDSKEELATEACSTAFAKTKAAWSGLTEKSMMPERVSDLVDFYLTPKPADRTCPMVAFSQDAATAEDGSFSSAYAAGIGELFSQFDSLSDACPEDRERNLVLFAAMVGANVLTRAGAGGGLSRSFKSAILNFASQKPNSPTSSRRSSTRKKPIRHSTLSSR